MTIPDIIARVDAECRRESIPLLGRHKAARLVELVREARPRLVVEVGTAIGYSALWIASTLAELEQGRLVTIELEAARAARAVENFQAAGLSRYVTQLVGDACVLLADIEQPIHFLFLDGGFANYHPCLEACRPRLAPGATLVADNAGIGATEMADYLADVRERYNSHTEWFNTDLAHNPRDAMEISVVRE